MQCCHSLSEEKKYKKKYKKKYLKKKKYKKKYFFRSKKISARAYGARIKQHFNVPYFIIYHTFSLVSGQNGPGQNGPGQNGQKLATQVKLAPVKFRT